MKPTTVKQYIDNLDEPKRTTMHNLVKFILTEFPHVEAKIAWNVPQFHLNGKYVAGLAAFKNHLTYNPWSGDVIKKFSKRLANYVSGSHTFQVPVDWEIDKKLVGDLVRARLQEIE